MWKRIFEMAKQMILLTEATQRNSERIDKLQEQVRDLTMAFERLRYEIQRVNDKDDNEREKMALRLENELLKFERRLIPKRDDER